jgi:hypothetical protein
VSLCSNNRTMDVRSGHIEAGNSSSGGCESLGLGFGSVGGETACFPRLYFLVVGVVGGGAVL